VILFEDVRHIVTFNDKYFNMGYVYVVCGFVDARKRLIQIKLEDAIVIQISSSIRI